MSTFARKEVKLWRVVSKADNPQDAAVKIAFCEGPHKNIKKENAR